MSYLSNKEQEKIKKLAKGIFDNKNYFAVVERRNRRKFIVTAFGFEKTLEKIAVSLFDDASIAVNQDRISYPSEQENAWVNSKIIVEGQQYSLDTFIPQGV